MSAYLLGNLIFIIAWTILFIVKSKTRRLHLFGSFLLLPFAVLDIWFRPTYWYPPLLIKAIEPLSIETALYCFTAGGIAIVFGSFFIKSAENWRRNWAKTFLFIIGAFALFDVFRLTFHLSAMNDLNFAFLLIFLALFFLAPKENYKSIFPALIFAVFTILAINLAKIFYPGFVAQYWNLNALWPTFLGTPTEEIFFAGILGALWTLLPKYLLERRINEGN